MMAQQQPPLVSDRRRVDGDCTITTNMHSNAYCGSVSLSATGMNRDCTPVVNINALSYNMHGYNQGSHSIRDVASSCMPDVIMCQEHWLTPSNMHRFNDDFPYYMCFGSSAMHTCVEEGILRGRPFGGVAILVAERWKNCVKCICVAERYSIVKVGRLLFVNVYMPCAGTVNRLVICDEIINELLSWLCNFPDCDVIIGGDMNSDLDVSNPVSNLINQFAVDNGLCRCDVLAGSNGDLCTYYNDSMNTDGRKLDYFLVSDKNSVCTYQVLDLDCNLSDHRPIMIECTASFDSKCTSGNLVNEQRADTVVRLRWDHGNVALYRESMRPRLQVILEELDLLSTQAERIRTREIDRLYEGIIDILRSCANNTIPKSRKKFYKYWWDQELYDLKEKSIASCRLWKSVGRPRTGHIADTYRSDRCAYRNCIRRHQREEKEVYTNELHEALLRKQGTAFWKCWGSKFESKKTEISHVDGITDECTIAKRFADHFSQVCTANSFLTAERLRSNYNQRRTGYQGYPVDESYHFDAQLVESVIAKMKLGKAAGLDSVTTEHLLYSHPLLPCVLAKLFNIMMSAGYVPVCFGQSYTVPLLKSDCSRYGKSLNVENFRGVSISPAVSKVFEHCILEQYSDWLISSDNQFGFKKGSSCSQAIYTARCVIDYYVSLNTTVNICTLDLSKAFDKMNHHGLFLKLMDRNIPIKLLCVLEQWFSLGMTCVRWGNVYSRFIKLDCGIRQGGVLSPYLFAIYIDSLTEKIKKCHNGCYVTWTCVSILLYADDILLLAPSVTALQQLLSVCESELKDLDMLVNARKSACMRVGPRSNVPCDNIVTVSGQEIVWADNLRYLGVYLVSGRVFNCSFSNAKRAFYRSFNAIFGKIGRVATENVIVHLMKAKCLPSLYYGVDACPVKKSQLQSFNYVINSSFRKIFQIRSQDLVSECVSMFDCIAENHIKKRKTKFLHKYSSSSNELCSLFTINTDKQLSAL